MTTSWITDEIGHNDTTDDKEVVRSDTMLDEYRQQM